MSSKPNEELNFLGKTRKNCNEIGGGCLVIAALILATAIFGEPNDPSGLYTATFYLCLAGGVLLGIAKMIPVKYQRTVSGVVHDKTVRKQ